MAFVGQIATAGMGITLTAASTMVFYSLDYSMSNFEQTKARIHRVGQRMPCTYLISAFNSFTRCSASAFSSRSARSRSASANNCSDIFLSSYGANGFFPLLRGEGYGDMVYETVNANSLSAFVNEQTAENGDTLPAWLDGLVNVFEKTTVSLRKSSK